MKMVYEKDFLGMMMFKMMQKELHWPSGIKCGRLDLMVSYFSLHSRSTGTLNISPEMDEMYRIDDNTFLWNIESEKS